MATIRQIKSGKWCAEVRKNGQYLSRSFLTKTDAVRWSREVEIKVERDELNGDSSLRTTPLTTLLKRYQREFSRNKKGGKNECYRIEAFLKRGISATPLSQLTPLKLAQYRDTRLKEVQPDTINRELVIISHCLTVARTEWGYPLPHIPIPKAKGGSSARQRRLEGDEEDKLLKQLTTPYQSAVVILALETAMRRGERCGLTWGDVHLKKRIVHLTTTKNGEARSVPLSPLAIQTLQALPRRIDGSVLGYRCTHSITRFFKRACLRAGIENLRLHDLRHEATSRLFEKGFNMMEVATITGHKDLRMLRRYTHLRAEDLARRLG